MARSTAKALAAQDDDEGDDNGAGEGSDTNDYDDDNDRTYEHDYGDGLGNNRGVGSGGGGISSPLYQHRTENEDDGDDNEGVATPYSQEDNHNNIRSTSHLFGADSDLDKTKSPPLWQQQGSNNAGGNEGYFSPPSPSPPKSVRLNY